MNYRDNFDEFGNLRENHSPWCVRDLCGVCAIFAVIVVLMSGVMV